MTYPKNLQVGPIEGGVGHINPTLGNCWMHWKGENEVLSGKLQVKHLTSRRCHHTWP